MPLDDARPCPGKAGGGQNPRLRAVQNIDAGSAPIKNRVPTCNSIFPESSLPALRSDQLTGAETVARRLASTASLMPLRGYVEMPTGAGKSALAATVARRCLLVSSERPVLFLAQRRELVRQQAAELARWSHFPVSILMAGEKFEAVAPLIVASVQTLLARPRALRTRPALVLIDECHHASADSAIDRFLQRLGNVPVIGLSATPRRSWERPAPILTECIFARGLPEMIAAGVLAPLESERIEAPMSLAEIATRQGDYAGPALALEAERNDVIAAVVRAAAPRILTRPGPALCFGVTVAHTRRLAAAFARAGVATVCVWGSQASAERVAAFNAWRQGNAQLLVNCAIVSEGIDLPALRTIIIARPTRSRRLYLQIIGRGTRPAPGKSECLILEACAVRPDPQQVLLGAFVPERAAGGGPPTLQLLDPEAADKWSWQFHAGSGAFSVRADSNSRVYLIPEGDGSGLYRAVLHERDEPFRPLSASLAQAEAMHCAGEWLTRHASLSLAASTRWHSAPASPAQIRFLGQISVDAAELTRGEASALIADHIAARVVPQIVRRLWQEEQTQ